MDGTVISKFGGTSLANAEQIDKVRSIIEGDSKRKVVIVSAPGKENKKEEKITDHLFNIAKEGKHYFSSGNQLTAEQSHEAIINKFGKIMSVLGIDQKEEIMSEINQDLSTSMVGERRVGFLASRGEHYNAKIIALYFQKRGMNAAAIFPEDVGFILSNNLENARVLPETSKNLEALAVTDKIIIFPGYYGKTREGDIAVLPRSGSDISADQLASALNASLYENWKDTDGIYQASPKFIPDAKVISMLTYKETRILAANGFEVFHYDAMLECKKKGIPINIRNTNNPGALGTMIVSERVPRESVVGIARMDDMAYVYVEKDMMDEEVGFTSDLLQIFREQGISTHHYPTDKDEIAIIVDQKSLNGKANKIKQSIESKLKPDRIEFNYNISLLVPVGIGIRERPDVLARATQSLADKKINIEIATQSPAQISFIFGVKGYNAQNALEALYNTFFNNK